MDKTDELKKQILDGGILDREGVHHVFSQGLHGRKIDFDLIPDDSELFNLWTDITAEFIRANYPNKQVSVVGVANGTNRLATAVAEKLSTQAFITVKPEGSRNQPVLTDDAKQKLEQDKPEFLVVLEDVGTTGTNSSSVARSLKQAGFDNFEIINTWQRSDNLPLLDEIDVPYKAIIKEKLISYKPDECKYCADGWELLGHGQTK